MNIAIILASGTGSRMGAGKNKTLLKLANKPLIYYSISNFQKSALINKIILVVKDGEKEIFEKIVKKYNLKKVKAVIIGGPERQDSAQNGVEFIGKNFKEINNAIILFHNGANPFVTKNEIEAVINSANKFGAAVVAHKTKDTIRKVDKKDFSIGVVERHNLWNMQTPQAIKLTLALKAFRQAKQDNFLGTDDVSLVERLGKKVKIVEASINNFKITTPLDFELAKIILKKI